MGDPQKKRNYDMTGSAEGNLFMNGGMPGGMGMDNIFSSIFGNGGMPGVQVHSGMPNVRIFRNGQQVYGGIQKPTVINKKVSISLNDAYNGINIPLEIERWIMIDNTKSFEKEKLYVDIPKGVDTGEIIKIPNKGNILSENNKGDIKIFITVTNSTIFKRNGLNLILTKNLSLKDALTGFKFDFKHLNGKTYAINNEEGNIIKPNYRKEIHNLGMERKSIKGKLIVIFNIEFPSSLTSKQIKEIKEIL